MFKKILALAILLNTTIAYGAAKLQNEDFKSLSQITAAGGTAANLLNDSKVYVTANGINQQLSAAIQSGLIGGGGGTNLVGNGTFEASGITGWSVFQTTVGGSPSFLPTTAPTTCTTCTVAISANTSTPLDGAASLSAVSTGVSTAGQGFISNAFAAPIRYQGKTMSIGAVYSVVSGLANLNLTGTTANTKAVYIYDVTNAAWIQPSGAYNIVQGSGVGIVTGTFAIPSNSISLRIAVIDVNPSAGANSVLWDDFLVGPQVSVQAPVISDWQFYTPTFVGLGTVPASIFKWRRVGSSLEIEGQATTGTPTSSIVTISLPNGYVTAGNGQTLAGSLVRSSTGALAGYVLNTAATNYLNLGIQSSAAGAINPVAGNGILGTTDAFAISAKVQIAGWASGLNSSADTNNNPIQAMYIINASSIATNTAIGVQSTQFDNSGSVGPFGFTCPSPGFYTANGFYSQTNGVLNGIGLYVAGTAVQTLGSVQVSGQTSTALSGGFTCKAGQLITISPQNNTTSGSGNIIIQKAAGAAVLQAGDPVAARAFTSATSVPANTATSITYTSKTYDLTNSMNISTGFFVAPAPGRYMFTAYVQLGNAATQTYLTLTKNGTTQGQICLSSNPGCGGSDVLNLVTGDSVGVQMFSNVAGTAGNATFTAVKVN